MQELKPSSPCPPRSRSARGRRAHAAGSGKAARPVHTVACGPLGVPAKLPSSPPSLHPVSPPASSPQPRAPPDALSHPFFTHPCRDSLLPVPVYSMETTRDHVLQSSKVFSRAQGCCASQALSSRSPATHVRGPPASAQVEVQSPGQQVLPCSRGAPSSSAHQL